MILLPLMLPSFYYMDNPAWSRSWYTDIVDTCLSYPQAEVVDLTGEMTHTTRKVLEWIKDRWGHQFWQICCNLIHPKSRNNIYPEREFVNIWSILVDVLEYMSLLIKEFSGRPAEL